MKKKTIAFLFVVIAVLFAVGVGAILLGMPKTVYVLSVEENIIAQSGVVPEEMVYNMEVPEDGDYEMYIKWTSNPSGMLMACNIEDENGNSVNTLGAHWMDMASGVMPLAAGNYTLTLTPFTDAERWMEYWAEFDKTDWDAGTEDDEPESELIGDGEYRFEFEFRLTESRNVKGFVSIVMAIIGVLLFVIVLAVVQRENSMKQNYDERQELLRGRGAKYGLISMLFLNVALYLLESMGVQLPMSAGIAVILSVFVGGGVYAVYCIWMDAYFALNQRAGAFAGFLFIIGVINLVIGITALSDGRIFQNNQLTDRSLNLFCGIMMIILCGSMLLKKVCKDREEE